MGTAGQNKLVGRAMVAGLAIACLRSRLELAVRASELEEDHRLSMEFVTPHTKWAQPYAAGKTRMLVFIDGDSLDHPDLPYGTLPREIIELKQRFDLDAASVYWITSLGHPSTRPKDHWLHRQVGIERMLNLLGQPWDCYVLYEIPLEWLPVEGQYRLLKGVAEGSGLVTVGTDDKGVLKEKNRLKSLPGFGRPMSCRPRPLLMRYADIMRRAASASVHLTGSSPFRTES